jgi:hypothetical protein
VKLIVGPALMLSYARMEMEKSSATTTAKQQQQQQQRFCDEKLSAVRGLFLTDSSHLSVTLLMEWVHSVESLLLTHITVVSNPRHDCLSTL